MKISHFSLEFELNVSEIRKLNKMYFKNLYKCWVIFILLCILFFLIFLDFFNVNDDKDVTQWIIRSLVILVFFLVIQYPVVNTICNFLFKMTKRLLKFDKFISTYKLSFTDSFIYINSPLGHFTHKWSQIEKAILTKNFFFLYVKERNIYIISISNKNHNGIKIKELITFVENHVTQITKV